MKRIILINILIMSFFCIAGNTNAHGMKKDKKAILLVTFGTSYPEARVTFTNIEEQVREVFPDVELRWAYTSKMIRKKLKKRGELILSPAEALAQMGEDGFTHVAVQSLHVIPGEEYENLKITVQAFNGMPKGIKVAKLGAPLLFHHQDNQRLAEFLTEQFQEYAQKKEGVVFMGHGTHHQANIYYPGLQFYMDMLPGNFFLGTVEGFPMLDQIIPQLKKKKIKELTLVPFMSVAGDHAQNDMAGSEEDSWKTILEKEGFQVKVIMKGLAEFDPVVHIWIDHLKDVYNNL